MKTELFKQYDLSNIAGRVLIAGDVHGCFSQLESQLAILNYDKQKDVLVFVGDLIDRGPESHKAIDWCNQEPAILRVIGNHEQMLEWTASCRDDNFRHENARRQYRINGGAWWLDLPTDEEKDRHASILCDAPVALEISTPGGNQIGIVHATVPGMDWLGFRSVLSDQPTEDLIHHALWDHSHFDTTRYGINKLFVTGIDHVFLGHMSARQISTNANCTWLDTGAGKHALCTVSVVDADAHIEKLKIK